MTYVYEAFIRNVYKESISNNLIMRSTDWFFEKGSFISSENDKSLSWLFKIVLSYSSQLTGKEMLLMSNTNWNWNPYWFTTKAFIVFKTSFN